MSRKNVFDVSDTPPGADPAPVPARPNQSVRPLLGLDRPLRPAAPLGAISQSLSDINAKVKRADDIERALAEGQAVVDLDPTVIDDSIVPDRMPGREVDHLAFVEAIRENGQQVPILVRPKPGHSERYEVAYGHRRLRAARALERPVRAVVRTLSDADLVVAQGQENSARTDLTFIERARFALRLEDRKFKRETIMAAMNIDKTGLSRLIAVAASLPADIVDAIGPAPAIGRGRWQDLVALLETEAARRRARDHVAGVTTWSTLDTNTRFEHLYTALRKPVERADVEAWSSADGAHVAKIRRSPTKLTLAFDDRTAPEFGEFVTTRLQALYDEYRSARRDVP